MSQKNNTVGKILELRAPTRMPDMERTTTISKLLSARGELEDVLARQNRRHTAAPVLLAAQERHSLREMLKQLEGIVNRLEQERSDQTKKHSVV